MNQCPPRTNTSKIILDWLENPENLLVLSSLFFMLSTTFFLLVWRQTLAQRATASTEPEPVPIARSTKALTTTLYLVYSSAEPPKKHGTTTVKPRGKRVLTETPKEAFERLKAQLEHAPFRPDRKRLPPYPSTGKQAVRTVVRSKSELKIGTAARRHPDDHLFGKISLKHSFFQNLAKDTNATLKDLMRFVNKRKFAFSDDRFQDTLELELHIRTLWKNELQRRVKPHNSPEQTGGDSEAECESTENSSDDTGTQATYVLLNELDNENFAYLSQRINRLKELCAKFLLLPEKLTQSEADSILQNNKEIFTVYSELTKYQNGIFADQIKEILDLDSSTTHTGEGGDTSEFLAALHEEADSLSRLGNMTLLLDENKTAISLELAEGSVTLSSLHIPARRLRFFRSLAL